MSIARRKQAIQEYHRIKNERDTSSIQYLTFTINKSDWLDSLKQKIIQEIKDFDQDTGDETALAFKAYMEGDGKSETDKSWKAFKKHLEGWMKFGKRPTWYTKKDGAGRWVSDNGKSYTFTCVNRRQTLKSGNLNKKWAANAIRSLKKNVIKKWHKGISTAEHGKLVQKFQKQGAMQQLSGFTMSQATSVQAQTRPGSEGNNINNAIIAGIVGNASTEDWLGWEKGFILNYFQYKYGTKVDRRKTKNSIQRNHTIRIVMMPGRSVGNTGAPDKSDSKEFLDLFTEEFNTQMTAYASTLTGLKKVNYIADSPNFDDEGAGISEDQWIEQIERSVKAMQRSSGRMNQGIVKKTKISFKKQLEKVRYEKKQGKEGFVTPKSNKAVKTVVATKKPKVKKVALSKVSPNKRGEHLQNSGFRMDKEGLLIRDLINRLLPRAMDKNMVRPRLQNQSGRLRRESKVEQVIVGPRGGLYIDYSYPQKPYGVFEPGTGKAPWANQFRDPRHLIGMSIREIVAVNMGGQPVASTRRVFS